MSGPSPATVTCRGLTKRFPGGQGILAVDALDLDVPAGSVFGLLGPNGAGKTTTLRLVTGLARPTAGTVSIDDLAVTASRDQGLAARRGIGVLDQDPRYYGWMTGRELVVFAGRLQGLDRREAGVRADATLEQVGPRRCAAAADRRVLGRDAPATRDRPGARRRAAAADPRRAGQLARPGRPARPPDAHRGPPRQRHGHLLDPCAGRRRADLRPGRHPRPWPSGDRGSARRAARALRHAALPDRPGTRAGRGSGRAGSGAPFDTMDRRGHRTRRGPDRVGDRRARGIGRAAAACRRRGRAAGGVRARPAVARGRLPAAGRPGAAVAPDGRAAA